MNNRVLLGMSGGVDSSAAALLLKSKGYDVIGATIRVYGIDDSEFEKNVNDAVRVCDVLKIPHHILDFREIFKKNVVDFFIEEYLSGRTPNPCVRCNKLIKFGEFVKAADKLEASYISTGHYARIDYDENSKRFLLKRPIDRSKDQTYVLYNMTQEVLKRTLFPLYGYTKPEIRDIAEKAGLEVAKKRDSQEICFIPNDDHGEFISGIKGDSLKIGYFIYEGKRVGKHKGVAFYTIGQRKGLGIALGKPVFVTKIDPVKNFVYLGDETELFKNKLYVRDVNFIPFEKINEPIKVTAKIRYKAVEKEALISNYEDGVLVEFDEPQRAITIGQSAVFYDGDTVVGGGIIDKVL